MDDIFRIANLYYTKLESFNIFAMIRRVSFWGTLILTICFLYFIFSFFHESAILKSSTLFTRTFGLAVLSEIFMLLSMSELQKDKREYICQMMEAETGINSSSIVDVRISLLKKLFSCSRDKFYYLAQDIQNSLSSATLLSNDYSRIDRFFSFIYNKDANNRVLALFALISSIITILAVNSGQNISALFELLQFAFSFQGLKFYSVILILSIFVLYGLTAIFRTIKEIAIFISLKFVGDKSRNTEVVKYLIRDLNNYHSLSRYENKSYIKNKFSH